MKPRNVILLLLLLCGVLYFSRLGSLAFFEEDEPRFAAAARTMLETGDYITPRFNGKLRINKPILYYWLAVPSLALFGVGEFGARFPSAVLTTALVLTLFLFARRYGSTRYAAIAAFATATCLQFTVLGRAAVADMGFIFFLTAALLAFYRAYTDPADRRCVPLSWAALALATLAKGPAAVVLAGSVVLLFLLLRGDLGGGLRRLCTPLGLLLFLLIAVPWFAAELVLLGKTFYRGFFLAEHFGRYAGTADPHHGPVWYFVPVLLGVFYPWSCFLPAGLAGVWRERHAASPLRFFCLCWIAVVFGIFSFCGTKLPHYIAPLYPAAALLVAWAWEERLARRAEGGWRFSLWMLAVVGGLLTAAFAILIHKGPQLLAPLAGGTPQPVGPAPALLAVLFGVGWLGCLLLLRQWRPAPALGVLGGTLVAAILCLHLGLAPVIARHWQEPLRDLAVEAAAHVGDRGQIALFAYSASGVVYYGRHPVVRVRQEQAYRLRAMARRGPLLVITTTRRLPHLPSDLGLRELRRRGGFVLLGVGSGG